MERGRRGRSAASTPAKKEAPKEVKKEAPPPKKEEEKKMEVDPPKVEEKKETPAPVEEKPAEEPAPAEDNADKDISNGQNDTQGDANEDEDEDDEDDEANRLEDGDKIDDDKSLIVKIKGLPKVGTNKMHLLLHDLFSSKLEIPLPLVRHPKGNKDKWIYAECQSLEDKKKILATLNGSYKYKEKDGTVEYSLQAAPGWVYTEQKSSEPLDMESALDILFKYRKMPYKEQLATKTEEAEKMMTEIFEGLKKINPRFARIIEKYPTINRTVPMIPTVGYTFDSSFTIEVDPETKKVVVGLRASNRTAERVIPIDLCPNIPKIMADAVKDFVDHLDEYGLKPFDRNTETGNIVGIQCKMSTSCEIIMSVLVPKENTFLKEFLPIKTPEEVNKAIEERKKEMEARAAAKAEAEAKAKAEAEAKAKADAEAKEKKTEGEEKKEETKEEEKKEETAAEDKDKSDANDSKADDSVALIEMDDEEKPTDEEKAKYGRQLKEIKPGLLKYFHERGKELGIVSIFSNWILYNRRGDWAGRQHFYHHICGATTVKEQIINLQYDLWPYKQWSPRTSTFGTILNTIDSLVQLDKSTSIAVASEFRLVALYYAKRCRDVLSVLSWSGKSSNQMHVRYIHKQGVKNIEFVSTKASAFKALDRTNFARTSEPRVAIVWGFSKAGLLRKFHNMGVKRIITVYHVRGNVQPDLKKYLEAVAPHMAVTKVTPVDTQPHGGQYALVFLLEDVMGAGPGGQKRKMNEPMHLGAKRKRPPPLMHESRKGAWDSGPMGPPMQSAVDPLNSTISQLTGFMQSQMLFNEMMKAGIQEILPQRDAPVRAASPPPKYAGGRSSWGGRGSRDGGGRFADDYSGRDYNGRDGSPGRWGNKRDEGFGRRNSPKSLTEAVWGPQSASMEDRRSYANRPPNWGASVDKPGAYDKQQSFNNRYDRGDNYNYDRRDNKRPRDGGNWNRY